MAIKKEGEKFEDLSPEQIAEIRDAVKKEVDASDTILCLTKTNEGTGMISVLGNPHELAHLMHAAIKSNPALGYHFQRVAMELMLEQVRGPSQLQNEEGKNIKTFEPGG